MESFEERVDSMILERMSESIPDEEWIRIQSLCQHLPSGEANPEWLAAREHVVTGSAVAGAVGNGYASPISHLKSKVWPKPFQDSDATRWGNFYEDECETMFCLHLQARCDDEDDDLVGFEVCEEKGLIVNKLTGRWQGYSPDGIVKLTYSVGGVEETEVALCEYKCPWSLRNSNKTCDDVFYQDFELPPSRRCRIKPNGRRVRKQKKRASSPTRVVDIKPYYFDQVQWGANILSQLGMLKPRTPDSGVRIFFVVWTPSCTKVQQLWMDKGYYEDFLLVEAEKWYTKQYIPNIVQKELGMLSENEVEWSPHKIM